MSSKLLSSEQAARHLGISVLTLYDWLSQSDAGMFMIRGQPTTIKYFQGGRKGQGRIKIDCQELDRLMDLMLVTPRSPPIRRAPRKQDSWRHITTKLGRPDD